MGTNGVDETEKDSQSNDKNERNQSKNKNRKSTAKSPNDGKYKLKID